MATWFIELAVPEHGQDEDTVVAYVYNHPCKYSATCHVLSLYKGQNARVVTQIEINIENAPVFVGWRK